MGLVWEHHQKIEADLMMRRFADPKEVFAGSEQPLDSPAHAEFLVYFSLDGGVR